MCALNFPRWPFAEQCQVWLLMFATSFGAGRVLPLFWSGCRPFLWIAHHRLHPACLQGHGRSHSNLSNILKIFLLRCQNPHRCTTWWSLAAVLLWAGLPQTSGTVEEGEEEFCKPSSIPQLFQPWRGGPWVSRFNLSRRYSQPGNFQLSWLRLWPWTCVGSLHVEPRCWRVPNATQCLPCRWRQQHGSALGPAGDLFFTKSRHFQLLAFLKFHQY